MTAWSSQPSLGLRSGVGTLGVCMALGACNALFGVDDLTYDPSLPSTTTGGSTPTGGPGGAPGGAAGASGGQDTCPIGYACRPSYPNAPYLGWMTEGACEPGLTHTILGECSGCDCVGAANGSCSATVDLFADAQCGVSGETESGSGSQGSCHNIASFSASPDVRASAATDATPGSCAPAEDVVALTALDACSAPPDRSCGGGVCVREDLPCVVIPEQEPCQAPYQLQRLIYDGGGTDGCTCSCAAQGSCPNANLWAYPGGGCDGSGQHVPADDSCVATGLTLVRSVWILAGAEQTSCVAAGTADSPRKLCCLPPTES